VALLEANRQRYCIEPEGGKTPVLQRPDEPVGAGIEKPEMV
jgi:hypothetical protein